MIIAASIGKNGRHILILGLLEDNIQRLKNDEPIRKNLNDIPGLENWDLYILGPEDVTRFVAATGKGEEFDEFFQ